MKERKYVTSKKKFYVPSREMKRTAWVSESKIYRRALKNPFEFWESYAKELVWVRRWRKVYREKLPHFSWFVGGKLNACYNCVDRWLEEKRNKIALMWEPENPDERERKFTYYELYREVNRFASALKALGVEKGDRVSIYLPMIPETIIAMLACARIGAIHSVVFSAFSSEALKTRLIDCDAKLLITCDGYYRRGKLINLKENADEAKKGTKVEKTLVIRRAFNPIKLSKEDYLYDELRENVDGYVKPKTMDSEDILFILYTSGTTGKPKGIVHTHGGYLVQAYTTAKLVFDLHESDVFFSTADIGWITGHTYSCYGPLLNGASVLIYEGTPDYPSPERIWQIIEKYGVTIFYTAPTLIRMMMKYGDEHVEKHKMESLRLLASVGEPIDEKSWRWFFEKVGKKRCPIIDTWWQTETGGTLINTLPGIGPFIPTYAGLSFPGTRHEVLNEEGKPCKAYEEGNLVQLPPFAPGMLRGVWKNEERYRKTYWSRYKNLYFTEDRAYKTKEGYIRITGRADDVIKVAGHRLSTAEIENAIASHRDIAEVAVVAKRDEIKGEVPVAFVVAKPGREVSESDVIKIVERKISKIARPKHVIFVDDLPHTRSGKIMRRVLKRMLNKEDIGNVTTLANPESVQAIERTLKKLGMI